MHIQELRGRTVRHLQCLGGLLAHIGFSFLLSALYSLLATPLIVALIYFISRKEEDELTKEFGEEYASYKKKVQCCYRDSKS
jgi:protein-S-isoprenylcysteine O-methyltransferase Ste14